MIHFSEQDKDRFQQYIEKTDDDCWLWIGGKHHNGYGQFWLDGRSRRAHVVALLFEGITVPRGLECHHICEHRNCVNPSHINLVSHTTNLQIAGVNKRQTHCKRGHPLYGYNLGYDGKGQKKCKACNRMHAANSVERRKYV